MGPGPVWAGAENLAPAGIQSPDGPARSQSLYWLRYPAHFIRKPTYADVTGFIWQTLSSLGYEMMPKKELET